VALMLSWLLGFVARDVYVRVDFIERNHARNIDQYVFWDIHRDGMYHVVAWRLAEKCGSITRTGTGWDLRWREGGMRYSARGTCYRETWTRQDVELADREFFPEHERRGLR